MEVIQPDLEAFNLFENEIQDYSVYQMLHYIVSYHKQVAYIFVSPAYELDALEQDEREFDQLKQKQTSCKNGVIGHVKY